MSEQERREALTVAATGFEEAIRESETAIELAKKYGEVGDAEDVVGDAIRKLREAAIIVKAERDNDE